MPSAVKRKNKRKRKEATRWLRRRFVHSEVIKKKKRTGTVASVEKRGRKNEQEVQAAEGEKAQNHQIYRVRERGEIAGSLFIPY